MQPSAALIGRLDYLEDRVSALNSEIADARTGREKGTAQRRLNEATQGLAVARVELEQTCATETELWETLWRTPQASMWDGSAAFTREVATFVRWQVRAEQGDLKAAGEARQRSDRLGLTPLALMRLRAEVERAEDAEARGQRRRTSRTPTDAAPARPDPRQVLRLTPNGR
ncbi:hypothetical protein MM440_12305 [Arsenicicoccus piscis]|uniref:phage terminase small subunit n=1 Tax=Arsenicicoccus piscis TaxID=673954 RepID=UPI001F4D1000|nr:hypothetical protein [Arsenicicoccus piscis]MCH8628527.1 hypothetical protein [Arsenicicoccus piscis]